MKTLVDIKNEKALISQIDWDMKPRERIRRKGNETREEIEPIERQMQARVRAFSSWIPHSDSGIERVNFQ